MKSIFILPILFLTLFVNAQNLSQLSTWKEDNDTQFPGDWLLTNQKIKAGIYQRDGREIILYNGLVKRTFRTQPNLVCTGYKNMINGQQLLRAIMPEAEITIDGKRYNVGGLYGQKEKAYFLPEWIDSFSTSDQDFQYTGFETGPLQPDIKWNSEKWWASNKKHPTGKEISFVFQNKNEQLKNIIVKVHYSIYDGLPLITKWLTVENKSSHTIKLNRVKNEMLALVEEESAVVGSAERMKKQQGIYIETNYAFNNAMRYDLSDQTLHWTIDSSYTSQVNYNYNTPCIVEVYPDKAPGIELETNENYTSVKSFELLMDSYDRERRGLAIRRMYAMIAPWTTANPIFMHLVSKNDREVKTAIDQCAATGYEALILSFGSDLNMEDSSKRNIERWKSLAAYAHNRGIKIGGYSLFSSRRISDEDDVIHPATGKPGGAFFGNAPCFGSAWGLAYRDKIKYFFTETGFDIWENDGPYPGDVCASTVHPGHKGLDDSQWRQMEIQKELYRWLNEKGVYINAPDWYFLDGTHKIAIGYREVNFSLPRENQKILNRQNIYDGTWEKTPSMGWGFVPLTKYQGGGPEAILEPLSEHLNDYEQLMMQYYGSGVQACYRGPRLYDTEQTKETVEKVIHWYKRYRDILNSDIIHLRRADGRDWDGILHVNPALKTKGLLMLYNPTKEYFRRTITLPLYYSGIKTTAMIREKEGAAGNYKVNEKGEVKLNVSLLPESYSWWIIE
ncbi:alpha-galactosidase [Pollutibacter soli]|uniref:alpha-galactosidase n=1 Tax=Pollutibacter soli TaxID=3034157 RepID=UPI0030133C5D